MANYFQEDEARPIVSAWIEQGFEIDQGFILEAIEADEQALSQDVTLSAVAAFGSIASGCLMLALAGFSAPMLIPVGVVVSAGLMAWNSDCAKGDRELEGRFLREYPQTFDRISQRVSAGEGVATIAASYGQMFRAYRKHDRAALTQLTATATAETQAQSGIQNGGADNAPRTESPALAPTELQPIAIAQDATTAALPSSTSVKPGDSIGLDLAAVLLAMPEFCHILLAGENGTGKTTFAMALLKPIINKFIQITGFELLLIDPKRSRWNGLFQTKSYQSAFSNQPHDLERSVNRLELIYFKLDKLSSDRQKTGKRTEVPTLVIIDEVNTWLDALKAFDRNFKEENSSLPPAERSPAPRLYNRAVDSIAGISRMGREDRVWLWLIGQNSNLEALGLSGAQDRANFSIVAVGLGDNQITIELALSNSTMFTRGQALKNALKEHQGKPYQIAACTRKPANLLIMPSSYKDNAQEDFSAEILARLGSTGTTPIAPSPSPSKPIAPPQSRDEWDGIPEVESDGPDSAQWDLIDRFAEETGQGYFNNPNFDLWLKKQTYVDGKAVRVSSDNAPGRALPGQTIEVETTAIDERPEGLDDFPLVLTIWEYLDGNDARSMKQIRDYVRLKDRMPEEVLRAKIPTMENFNDGVKAVVSFGVSQGFLREVSGDSFESIRKH